MTTAQVIETSVTVNNNSPIQDYAHQDDQAPPTYESTGTLRSDNGDVHENVAEK